MTELQERVVARLVTAQNAQDPSGLRGDDAVGDALALLREAAPSPEESVDLESVAAVFWSFWFRYEGPEGPDAQRDLTIALSAFAFIYPRLPDTEYFPEQLRETFDPTDPWSVTGFEHVMSSAHGEDALNAPGLTEPERLEALDRALAWSDTAQHHLPPDHGGFVQLGLYAVRLHTARFQFAASVDSLAVAARNAAAVCERLPSVPPNATGPAGAAAPAFALGTVLDAARFIGDPPLSEVERLAILVPDALNTPEVADALESLRQMYAEPVDWPGELDLRAGVALVDAGTRQHDAGRIACGVRRLRAALDRTPPDHPARVVVTVSLGRGVDAFATERGYSDAVRQAGQETVERLGGVDAADVELLTDLLKLNDLEESGDAGDAGDTATLVGDIVDQLRERAAREGGPPDIDLEVICLLNAISAGAGDDMGDHAEPVPVSVSDEQIVHYRAALAALPADHPHRYAYVAVLAALTGTRAAVLRESQDVDTAADRGQQLADQARSLTDEVAADAPAGFLPLGLLRQGHFGVAVSVSVVSIPTGAPDYAPDPEVVRAVSLLSRTDALNLTDPEHLDADIEVLRELLAETGEEESGLRATLAAGLGIALAAQGAADNGDPATLDEIVQLLRYARTHGAELGEAVDQLLASALTTQSTMNFDGAAAREASALLATAVTEGAPTDAALLLSTLHTEVHAALQNYLLGHEPGQLVHAREVARRLKEFAGAPVAGAAVGVGDDLPGSDVLGDIYIDLIETMGPGGGPKLDITDADVDRCRRTFTACPAGHPMRHLAGVNLIRALAQRAVAIHGTDPEREAETVGLVVEAAHVVDALAEETPDDIADALRFAVGLVAHLVIGGSSAAGSEHFPSDGRTETEDAGPARSPAVPPVNLFEFASERLRALFPSVPDPADPTARNHPAPTAWFRAHGEIGEAAGAVKRGDTAGALTHLEAAVGAMAEITDRGSDQQSAEHGLQTFEGDIRSVVELVLLHTLGRAGADRVKDLKGALEETLRVVRDEQRMPDSFPDTAEIAATFRTVTGPDVDRAAEVLERGRGLLLSRRIEARADLGELSAAHPELSREFERLTDQINAAPDPVGPAAGHAEWSRLARLRASRELDMLLADIRTRPGFDGFLRPLSAARLRALAADGPVVVLNHARINCQALIVTGRSITTRVLDITSDDVTDMARRMRDAVDAVNAQGTSRPSPLQLVAAGATIREVLAWTWHKIVHPVLELAGSYGPVPAGGAWPRIWWVPTGALNTLPLHAAQCTLPDCELRGCGAALDTVVSSYVPGFQTLAYARSRAGHREGADSGSALLVAASEEELPGVAAAAGYAAGLLGAREPLVGAAATREAVLAALGATSWVHFGCHAATDPAEPSGALLHLPNGETLSVLEICRTRPRSAQLAFLAACGTARTSERLSDEAIHITSAFLLAGFPAAVGTLWAIDSSHADEVTRGFYRRMTGDGAAMAPTAPAHALHQTVRELRRRIPDRPHVWAAYVHAGT
ncbi:CHAT domain-containing protein [Streptomyces niveus]|uniref:CHAT domain-containing protein n=1 Tax=Streptomyces niveus TaxID=193462 RepID=UPI0036520C7C